MKVLLWDLDGTLADNRHRLHLIKSPEIQGAGEELVPDWAAYEALASEDPLIAASAAAYRTTNFINVILTGRMEKEREATVTWLKKHALLVQRLLMRPNGDTRPNVEIKREALEALRLVYGPSLTIVAAFEDDPRVVAMYREREIPVFQLVGYR